MSQHDKLSVAASSEPETLMPGFEISTEGTDATMHITRTVKNDLGKWMLGLPDTRTECSTGSGLEQCRTITQTANVFGEVTTELTSSTDGIDDTKLFVTYQRDKYGNVTRAQVTDAFTHTRNGEKIDGK